MKDINYDQVLKGNVITVTLKGKKYEVQEPYMGRILDFQRESEKIKGLDDVVKAAMQIKKIIRTVYTDIPEKDLDGYSPKALYHILADVTKFVRESMLPEVIKEEQIVKEVTAKKGKKKLTTTS